MKSHLCDVAKHERDKLTVTEPVLRHRCDQARHLP
jgi:hypothetical protein